MSSLREQPFLLSPSPLGTFRAGERLRISVKNFHSDVKMYQRDKSIRKTVKIIGVYSSPEKAFEFCWSSFADEHTLSQNRSGDT